MPCEIDSYNGKSITKALFPTAHYARKIKDKIKDLPHMKNVTMGDGVRFMR